jgi:hypothetical protein
MVCPLSPNDVPANPRTPDRPRLLDAGILASRRSDYSDEGEIDIDSGGWSTASCAPPTANR